MSPMACTRAGVSRDTAYRHRKADEEFSKNWATIPTPRRSSSPYGSKSRARPSCLPDRIAVPSVARPADKGRKNSSHAHPHFRSEPRISPRPKISEYLQPARSTTPSKARNSRGAQALIRLGTFGPAAPRRPGRNLPDAPASPPLFRFACGHIAARGGMARLRSSASLPPPPPIRPASPNAYKNIHSWQARGIFPARVSGCGCSGPPPAWSNTRSRVIAVPPGSRVRALPVHRTLFPSGR